MYHLKKILYEAYPRAPPASMLLPNAPDDVSRHALAQAQHKLEPP